MKKILLTIGILCIVFVWGLPMYLNITGGDVLEVIDQPWYHPLLYIGIALIFIPTILSTVFSLKTVKSGKSAVGLIESIQQTGTYINEQPQIQCKVIVTCQGEDSYPAELRAVVPLTSLAQFQPGALIPLLVSPKDPSKVGIDWKGQVSQAEAQQLLNEQMIKQGVSPEMMNIATQGQQAYAKIIDVVPLGDIDAHKISLQLTLSMTQPSGETLTVNVQKEIFKSSLAQVQQGQIIRVVYLPEDPSQLVLSLQSESADLQHIFGATR